MNLDLIFQFILQNVNTMRHLLTMIDRRYFCYSLATVASNVLVAKLAFGARKRLKMTTGEQEFLIVNGWVLTREDVAASQSADVV